MTKRRPDHLVLIAEDDSSLLSYLRAEIRDHGYRAWTAEDGQRALELFLTEQPSIVVTNIHMPRMNGFQLLRAIKRLNPDTPVVLTTGFGHFRKFFPEKVERANGFFEKPIDIIALLNHIDKLLGFPAIYDACSGS